MTKGLIPKIHRHRPQLVVEKTRLAIRFANEAFNSGRQIVECDEIVRQVDAEFLRRHPSAAGKRPALASDIRAVDEAANKIPLDNIKRDAAVRWLNLTKEEVAALGRSRLFIRDVESIREWSVRTGWYPDDTWRAWPKIPGRRLTLTPEGAARLSEPPLDDGETPASRALLVVEGLPYLYRQAGGADKFWLRLRAQLNGGPP